MSRFAAPGTELELTIDTLAYGARGVARVGGFVVFVTGALPGDRVRARIERVKRRHAEATTLDVIEPGPDRVVAPCAHFPDCGGCRLQNLAYPVQAALKEQQVRDALVRIAGIADPAVAPIVPADGPYAYRNKLEYSFTNTPDGVAAGLHRAGRFDDILPITHCWLTGDLGNDIRDAVQQWARDNRLDAYEQRSGRGSLRHLVVREARTTGSALVVLVTADDDLPGRDGLVAALGRFPEVRSVHWAINDGVAEVTNLPTTLLGGEATIEERILGLVFAVGPTTFMQTNTAMVERLYGMALEDCTLRGDETAFDLYSGVGTISLALASRVASVFGMELSPASVDSARDNAARNGLRNATFIAGDVAKHLSQLVEAAGRAPDVVIVDPPRAGLAPKALRRIAELSAPRLVYVSCNPTTLAGDTRLIVTHGYRLESARPLDMFPQTPHVETVARFSR
ncbi:MAG: 23S rRNA (uracil-5-)-methyltransferase RumA [Chloroflexi bacterium 13_1_40CM_4_68_4]|nr:MAG: 23S rRNA (uracil-5-)-methyltransferase RumA [Chloroflexi bacterium 13_1_40CM_4_68_4]